MSEVSQVSSSVDWFILTSSSFTISEKLAQELIQMFILELNLKVNCNLADLYNSHLSFKYDSSYLLLSFMSFGALMKRAAVACYGVVIGQQ